MTSISLPRCQLFSNFHALLFKVKNSLKKSTKLQKKCRNDPSILIGRTRPFKNNLVDYLHVVKSCLRVCLDKLQKCVKSFVTSLTTVNCPAGLQDFKDYFQKCPKALEIKKHT